MRMIVLIMDTNDETVIKAWKHAFEKLFYTEF